MFFVFILIPGHESREAVKIGLIGMIILGHDKVSKWFGLIGMII
jgi:hypothetical protein